MASVPTLQGIRVVEIADYVFVPAAGGLLADWGADVVKVEPHDRGDAVRGLRGGFQAPGFAGDINVLYENSNRGKRSIGLNLTEQAGRDILYSLVKTADVFLTSKLPSVREKLGFDVEDLREHNPQLIYVRGSGTGSRGDGADQGGYDALCYWHRTGASSVVKAPEVDYLPFMPGAAFGDLSGGYAIAGGIALALLHRERTGEAPVVDVSLLGTGMWASSATIATAVLNGYPFEPPRADISTTRNPLGGNYRTKDGRFISLSCLQGFKYWAEACEIFGIEYLLEDERFATAESFFENAPVAAQVIADIFLSDTFESWIQRLATFSGQWAPVQNSLEVASDPEAIANRYVVDSQTADGRPMQVVTSPVQFDEHEFAPKRAPMFNEQCDEILGDVGLDAEAVLDLKIRGVVA